MISIARFLFSLQFCDPQRTAGLGATGNGPSGVFGDWRIWGTWITVRDARQRWKLLEGVDAASRGADQCFPNHL